MKKLPIGIQTFEKMIKDNYIYIDKTAMALDLIEKGEYYFLSRPRRFGKSLFIDTLHRIFEAKKELFEGLYIYDRYNWDNSYPVIKISFAEGNFHSKKELDKRIIDILKDNQKSLGVKCEDPEDVVRCFQTLIVSAYKKYNQKVVVLVDEYDKPILDNINNVETANELRDSLRNFYSVIKGSDEYLRFAFLTGVSKVSLFSGLNNLEDITLKSNYSSICGYTQGDVEKSFKEYLEDVNMDELKNWYNGYSWLGEEVYNPFDILLFLSNNCEYRNYWFETATPDFLIKLLRDKNYFLPNLEKLKANDSIIGSFEVDNIKVETLLFQTGYLTIKSVVEGKRGIEYFLGYPNKEVRISLLDYLIDYFTKQDSEKFNYQDKIYKMLETNNFDELNRALYTIFASIPYNNFLKNKMYEYEGYYSSVIYAYLASLGLDIIAEDVTNKGRIDLTLKFPDNAKVYIFEFKVIEDVKDTKKPLDQIKERAYIQKYTNVKEKYIIGIEFSKKERNIVNFEWESA